jgi:transcriptional regulator of acetoin/glycerol metabolism
MNALVEYDWPGNVRELENVIERAMILSSGPTLVLDESLDVSRRSQPTQDSMLATLEQIDRAHIIGVLEDCNWTIKGAGKAAERLGLAPSTLRYRMKKLGISRPTRKPR